MIGMAALVAAKDNSSIVAKQNTQQVKSFGWGKSETDPSL